MQIHWILKKAFLISILAVVVMGMGTGCKKKEAAPVPTVRAERLLEILRLFDMGNYEAAIPKIEQYQELDETNTFLTDMLHIAITNAAITKAEALLRQGKASEASQCIQDSIEKYGELSGLVQARQAFLTTQSIHNQILMLKKPLTSDVLASQAAALEKRANMFKNKRIALFAARKKADAAIIRQIERDRAGFLIYADVADYIQQGRMPETLSMLAMLENEKIFAEEGKRLRNEGVYCMPGAPAEKQIVGGGSNPNNKTTKTK